jgi:hypothetical protein
MENIKNVICSAIQSKKMIQFNYKDSTRVAEPYCYGESKTGDKVLRAFQVKGESESGNPVGWKLFMASKIKNVAVTDKYFVIGHHYSKEPVIKNSYCCIKL